MATNKHVFIFISEDPLAVARYIDENLANSSREWVVEILGDQFVASPIRDCWDRESNYFRLGRDDNGVRVLRASTDDQQKQLDAWTIYNLCQSEPTKFVMFPGAFPGNPTS